MTERTAIIPATWFLHFAMPNGWRVVAENPMNGTVLCVTNDPSAFPLENLADPKRRPQPPNPELLAGYVPEWAKPLDTKSA